MTPTSALSPTQAGLRFLIELAALGYWAVLGWNVTDNLLSRGVIAIALPVLAAAIWGTFRVPGDESASGDAPVEVRGIVRLMIELDVLLLPTILMAIFVSAAAGSALAVLVIAHYLLTLPRVRWLISAR